MATRNADGTVVLKPTGSRAYTPVGSGTGVKISPMAAGFRGGRRGDLSMNTVARKAVGKTSAWK